MPIIKPMEWMKTLKGLREEERKRMQSLGDVPEWVQQARSDTKEGITGKKAPKLRIQGIEGGGGPEGSGSSR